MGRLIQHKNKLENKVFFHSGNNRGYTIIQNELIDDELISDGARSLGINMLRLPANFDFSIRSYVEYKARAKAKQMALKQITDIKEIKSISEKTVRKYIKELEVAGYVKRVYIKHDRVNKHTKPIIDYHIYDVSTEIIKQKEKEFEDELQTNQEKDISI